MKRLAIFAVLAILILLVICAYAQNLNPGTGPGTGTLTSLGLVGTPRQITVTGGSPVTTAGSWTLSIPTAIPQWIKCTVTNSSTNLVVSGTGCTTATIAKAVGLTQSIPLFALSANGYVHNYRVKTSTAFAGTTTLLAGVGTTGTPNMFLVSASTGYNLNAAVAVGNLSTSLPLVGGSDTVSATSVVLALTSTIDTLDAISQGAVDVWILWSVLP